MGAHTTPPQWLKDDEAERESNGDKMGVPGTPLVHLVHLETRQSLICTTCARLHRLSFAKSEGLIWKPDQRPQIS